MYTHSIAKRRPTLSLLALFINLCAFSMAVVLGSFSAIPVSGEPLVTGEAPLILDPEQIHTNDSPVARGGLTVDPKNRQEAIDFYYRYYVQAATPELAWTGNHDACNPGSTSSEFRQAVLARINYFRAMAGIPADIAFNDEYNRKAQSAALMMSANRQLSHTPSTDWRCYSAEGAQAAGSSNLFLGVFSVRAIDGYIEDPGGGNQALGHRRWLLYPQTQQMGSGDVPSANTYQPSNALWVFDSNLWEERPATRDGYVAWPPAGYVPQQLIFPRWSLSYPGADFANATLSITSNGQPINAKILPVHNGYGENTLVWEPELPVQQAGANQPDVAMLINIGNALVDGQSISFSYSITQFDPAQETPSVLDQQVFLPLVTTDTE